MDEIFYNLAKALEIQKIYCSTLFIRDLNKIIKNGKIKFIKEFYNAAIMFKSEKYREYNRFEQLKKNRFTKQQLIRLRGIDIWRYEYRKDGYNLKCICSYIDNKPTFLCAFNEDNNKEYGKDSYKFNIDRIIKIINNWEVYYG